MSLRPRAIVQTQFSPNARSALELGVSASNMSQAVTTLQEHLPNVTRSEVKQPRKIYTKAADSLLRVPLDRKELYSSINKLKLRKKVRMVLIEIAVAIEETWVDQVTALIERNNLLKKQLRKRSVRPKK